MSKKKEQYHLLTNNRFWILTFSLCISIVAWVWVWTLVPPGELRTIRLQQSYGFFSLIFLYFALLATPVTKLFNFGLKETYLHARRAIGVSAFYFALLHALVSFFGQLGGFGGIAYLSGRYNFALLLGFTGLLVLTAMALTSFDKVIDRMGFPKWKRIHRLIYLASFAVLIHILMLGTHYAYGSSFIGRITFFMLLILLFLEAIRIDRNLKTKVKPLQHVGVASMVTIHVLFLGLGFLLGKQGAQLPSLAVHSSHTSHDHDEQYKTFDPVAEVDGHTIRISRKQISKAAVISGDQIVRFTVSPAYTELQTVECFMVSQQNFSYIHGLTRISPDHIDCLPIGDVNPPQTGTYTLYLRLTNKGETATTPFTLEVAP